MELETVFKPKIAVSLKQILTSIDLRPTRP